MGIASEDTHFYIDYAPPDEVRKILHCLSLEQPLSSTEIFDILELQGQPVKSRRTEIPRRLFDLGLASQARQGNRVTYFLTDAGRKLQEIDVVGTELYPDLMHFLHFSSWDGSPQARKFLWSYRRCSELAWREGRLLSTKDIASRIQQQMLDEFPHLDYTAKVGARFDDTAARRWVRWIDALSPSPFRERDDTLQKRLSSNHEIALLALDDVYRFRGYRYGDPTILDEALLDEVSRVFFLDPICCRELVDLAARLTKTIKLSDTFGGTSITLLAPYGIERI
jgi:DNA-binding transcriptional ArsR family regulator